MVKIRTAKTKGSQFEYDVQFSLNKLFYDIYRTSERGFQRQFDLHSEFFSIAVECKRLAGFSWNELSKYYYKLKKISNCKFNYLIFQGNRQPVLVMYEDENKLSLKVCEFKSLFGIEFKKHKSTRCKK